jgi:starch synthase
MHRAARICYSDPVFNRPWIGPDVTTPIKILFATAEVAPLMSTGGLADVAAALPKALKQAGHDVRLIMPFYGTLPALPESARKGMCLANMGTHTAYGALWETVVPGTDIPLYLIEHGHYFYRPRPYGDGNHEYHDNAERFCFFSQAALDAIPQTGWKPDLLHCHDWTTAPIPVYLKTSFARNPFWAGTPCLYTIHNLAYQGRYGADKMVTTGFDPELFHPECLEYHGDLNLMKGAITMADRISTVSPRYAREIQTKEYGEGLDGILRNRVGELSGILNGADYELWDPATDPHLPANYDRNNLAGKAVCKSFIQREFGFPEADVPLFGIVSRLAWQKGIDLLVEAIRALPAGAAQVMILGSGDPWLQHQLKELEALRPGDVRVRLDFNVPIAHQMQAGIDFFLMPSRYEPCGLSQFYSYAYGVIPIVRRSGGLADTVWDLTPLNEKRGTATGLSFVPLTAHSLFLRMEQAIELYGRPEAFAELRARGLAQDFSWTRSCNEYIALYKKCLEAA